MEKRCKEKRKRWWAVRLAAGCAVLMIGASWAYWSQEHTVANEFQLGKYSTGIVEEFEPPTDWKPGSVVNKDVEIRNEGTVPVYVKAVLSQQWLRRENIYDQEGNAVSPLAGEAFPLSFAAGEGEAYAALIGWGAEVVVWQAEGSQESTASKLPVVRNVQEAAGKWLLLSEIPDENGNLTAYYIGVLEGNSTTPRLVDSVRMHPEIEASFLAQHTVWDKETASWVTTQEKNPAPGYENAHYTLGVTMFTVQATKEAVQELFSAAKTGEQEIVAKLAGLGGGVKEVSRLDAGTKKKLYFEEVAGTMRYTPVMDEESWFMSHLNMLPGGTYEDTLEIENLSQKSYDLYLQVIPRDQEPLPEELLELIQMKVYQGAVLIYDGTALGNPIAEGKTNLQQAILLGTYQPGKADALRVELILDKDTPLAYAGTLSNIDWKFMVNNLSEKKTPVQTIDKTEVKAVKTGDQTPWLMYLIGMTAAGLILAGSIVYLLIRRGQNKRSDRE